MTKIRHSITENTVNKGVNVIFVKPLAFRLHQR